MKNIFTTIRNKQRGDTIVEVVLALTVLGLVLGTSSVLANRNTKTLQTSQENTYALRIAQAQLEYLRTYIANEATNLSDGDEFCLLGSTEDDKFQPDHANCKVMDGGAEYSRIITIEKVNEGKIQDGLRAYVNVKWETLTSPGNVQLTYRTYKKLVADDASDKSSCGVGEGLNEVTGECEPWAKPVVNFSANGESEIRINKDEPVQLTWTTSHATACRAEPSNGTWSGDKPASGSETVTPQQGTTKYEILCTGPGGNETKTVTVSIRLPMQPLRLCHLPLIDSYYNYYYYYYYYLYYYYGEVLWSPYLTTEDTCNIETHYQERSYSSYTYEQMKEYINNSDNKDQIESGRILGYVPVSDDRDGLLPVHGFFDEYSFSDLYYIDGQYGGYNNLGLKFYTDPQCSEENMTPLQMYYNPLTGQFTYNTGSTYTYEWEDEFWLNDSYYYDYYYDYYSYVTDLGCIFQNKEQP